MEIKASDVKALREKTGAGMMECKKALQEAEGDFKKAEKILKELGIAAAAKKSGRATNEGRIFTKITDGKAGILELACETDFVALNSEFVQFGNNLIEEILANNITTVTDALETKVKEFVGILKENITLRRFEILPIGGNEMVIDYIHGEGRIGVLVKVRTDKAELLGNEQLKQFIFDCALHIAAFNPRYLSKDAVDQEYLKEQEEIFTTQAKNLGKPEKVTQGIVQGKLNKHLSEICFLQQPFVKDDKQSVEKVVKQVSKEIGGNVEIVEYKYYSVGEEL